MADTDMPEMRTAEPITGVEVTRGERGGAGVGAGGVADLVREDHGELEKAAGGE